MDETVEDAAEILEALLDKHAVCKSHGIAHARAVMRHAKRALNVLNLDVPENEKLAVVLAALLHDADDHKFFPQNKNFENARQILSEIGRNDLAERVVQMIGYVSTSQNGDSKPLATRQAPWLLYPRYADRLEAIGWVGIVRCWDFTITCGREIFVPETPKALTERDIWAIATPERFARYKGVSASMVDHYYDKLLRVGFFDSGNVYLDVEALQRQEPLIELCLLHGKGQLSSAFLELAREQCRRFDIMETRERV